MPFELFYLINSGKLCQTPKLYVIIKIIFGYSMSSSIIENKKVTFINSFLKINSMLKEYD